MNIGRPKNIRYLFASSHPQFRSHLQMEWTTRRIPVLVGPQIPRQAREITRDRYCRAILTLFRPWLKATDLCRVDQSWRDAFTEHEKDFDDNTKRIIQNIEALHECKSDRETYLMQVLNEEINDEYIREYNGDAFQFDHEFADVDDDENDVLKLINLQDEIGRRGMIGSNKNNVEDLFIDEALEAISRTHRFIPQRHVSLRRQWSIEQIVSSECNLFKQHEEYYVEMRSMPDSISQNRWITQLKTERIKAREYIMAKNGDTNKCTDRLFDETNDGMSDEYICTKSDEKINDKRICVSTISKICPIALAKKISDEFHLNDDQNRAFMIIIEHLNGQSHLRKGN